MTDTLADALLREQARAREVLAIFMSIGPVGVFAAAMIEGCLQQADHAVMGGDIVAMLHALKDLEV